MSILDRLFKPASPSAEGPDIAFGRYSDAYKTPEQFAAWDRALRAFEADEFLSTYHAFFDYLFDPDEDNLKVWKDKDELHFELYQGSKLVVGTANRLGLKAEARIIHSPEMRASISRRLLELNFDLKYSRYALSPEDHICIVFDTAATDGSPYKLYHALKELATSADKQDDLLLDEFDNLQPLDTAHLRELPASEKQVKYQYIRRSVKQVLQAMEESRLDIQTYPGAFSYLLLELCYRLDYLIKPEGFMMETLERMNRLFFTNSAQNTLQKIYLLRNEFEELLQREPEEFYKEMYRVKTTFGITAPIDQPKIQSIIAGELHNMDWYQENGHEQVALAIPSYIVGYCDFTYAVPRPIRDFFHLYYEILEPDYFRDLGFSVSYRNTRGELKHKMIRRRIRDIAETHLPHYPKLNPRTGNLVTTDDLDFARSYLQMIHDLDLTPA